MAIAYTINKKKFYVSKQDKKLVESYTWYLMKARQIKTKYYVFTKVGSKTIYLHRLIMKAKRGQVVDHKDRNTLNFTRSNLRIVTASFNRINCVVRSNKKSCKYKGVFYKANRTNPYYAAIGRYKKPDLYLGSFATALEASKVYNKKMKELFGVRT